MRAEILQLNNRELRKFGFTLGAAIGVLFGLLLPWIFTHRYPAWPWWFAGTLVVWAAVWPSGLRAVYTPWMRFAHVLGQFNARVLLTIVFYLLIMPVGLLMRILGKDPMARRMDPRATSYRVRSQASNRNDMEKPY